MSAGIAVRHKILAAIFFAAGISQLQTPVMAACACLAALLWVFAWGKVCRKLLFRRLLSVNIFFFFLWMTLPLGLSGRTDAFMSLGPLCLHTTGLALASCITLKGNAIALCLLLLLDGSSVTENARALLDLRLPRKFVTLLLLTHASLYRMRREYTNIFHAAKLRGFVPSCSLRSLRIWGCLLTMLLVRSWQRSQAVDEAMRLRGFTGRFPLVPAADAHVASWPGVLLMMASLAVPGVLLLCESCGAFL